MRRPVYDTVLSGLAYETAATRMRADPACWLPAPARRVDAGIVVTMRAAGLLAAAGVDAVIDVAGPTLDQPGMLVRPIAWRAEVADRVFPRLSADIELEAVNAHACRLTLVGGYQPPISVLGDTADRVVGRHVAAAVVRTFLEGVAGELVTPCGPPTLRV
jgi:hypothetical protein